MSALERLHQLSSKWPTALDREIDKRKAFRNDSNQLSLEEKQQGDALGRGIELERERTK